MLLFTTRLTQVEGTGEDIIRSALARMLCEDIQQRGTDSTHEALEEVLQHNFVGIYYTSSYIKSSKV